MPITVLQVICFLLGSRLAVCPSSVAELPMLKVIKSMLLGEMGNHNSYVSLQPVQLAVAFLTAHAHPASEQQKFLKTSKLPGHRLIVSLLHAEEVSASILTR